MSAILNDSYRLDTDLGPDGVRRYKTRCKVLVDSHNAGANQGADRTVEITDDVYAVETGKTIKGAGNATISLTPSENYLNLIFPNDYVNIYFDIGDGSGWTRTFFGMVDRIEESYTVASTGVPSTTYRIVCTDFHKAFEKTNIYFNPHMAGRKDFQEYDFASGNIGGLTLMSKGIVVGGAPSDIIENVILLLIGFGTQFMLPTSYHPGKTQQRLRERRIEDVRGRLPAEAKKNLTAAGNSYRKLRDKARAEATKTVDNINSESAGQSEEERIALMAEKYGYTKTALLTGKSDRQISRILSDFKIAQQLGGGEGVAEAGTTSSLANRDKNLLDSTLQDRSSLVDIVDTYTFIERRAMDGYIFGEPVWQAQGSLISVLRSFSNESINELFFDLRPLSDDGTGKSVSDDPVAGKYARIPDDKDGNVDDKDGHPTGITYIPAVVMREYPFSTIESVDLSTTELSIDDEEGKAEVIGALYFGDIFNQGPNVPGRHHTYLPNINIAETAGKKSTETGLKHIDVAVVSEREIMNSQLGRSDNDHFNIFEFYSDNLLGTDQKFYLRDFLPLVTPIHILRNGLRVRSVTTRAARFSLNQIINVRQPTPQPDPVEKGDVLPVVAFGDIVSPVNSPDDVTYSPTQIKSNWGYRQKQKAGEDAFWKWHHGVDITVKPASRNPGVAIPVYAIADGWLVTSAPDGCYGGYGNVIVLKHNFTSVVGARYSVYAHLKSRAVGFGLTTKHPKGKPGKRGQYSAKDTPAVGHGGGTQTPRKINKGDLLGFMGHTGTTTSADHLHFEIDRVFPPFARQSNSGTSPNSDPILVSDPPQPGPGNPVNASGSTMLAGQWSCDPNAFFSFYGESLSDLVNQGQPEEDEGGESAEDDTGNVANEQDTNLSQEDEEVPDEAEEKKEESAKSVTRDSVDTASSRSQISRWALLQDHWYQHNLEYLSGRVDMRGAPEIRVGYRLDLADRNMSFYVEGVNHSWQFPNSMKTSLQVTRGQPNNPFPVYVLPAFEGMGATDTQRRTAESRLATYFITPDPVAIRRSLFLRPSGAKFDPGAASNLRGTGVMGVNLVDQIDEWTGENNNVATKYNEAVIPAGATNKVAETLPTAGADASPGKSTVTGVDPAASIDKDNKGELP